MNARHAETFVLLGLKFLFHSQSNKSKAEASGATPCHQWGFSCFPLFFCSILSHQCAFLKLGCVTTFLTVYNEILSLATLMHCRDQDDV